MSKRESPDVDSLAQEYESRLQSLIMWGGQSVPELRQYLDDAGIKLTADDNRLIELMKVDIRVRTGVHPGSEATVLELLTRQYPGMADSHFCELAFLEFQTRAGLGVRPNIEEFAERFRHLNRMSHEKLVAFLQSREETCLGATADAATEDRKRLDAFSAGNQIDSFEIGEQIGGGGVGLVFKARQLGPIPRDVALKIIRSERPTNDILARFDVERQSLAVMEHPNIAKIFDAGVTPDGRPFFVMELVSGVPLTDFCEKHGLGLQDRLMLLQQVCRAIQHAHQKGIIHRDIKPGNILVTMSEEGPFAKVIDFGLARVISDTSEIAENKTLTFDGQIVGTLRYMSPEQAGGLATSVDVKTDVYQLGVLLYELLTGVTPLEALSLRNQSLESVLSAIRTVDPERPSIRISANQRSGQAALSFHGKSGARLIDILKGDLDWIVMKAIAREPERRYQSVAHLSEDIERFLAGQPILARPPSLVYRLSKTLRRHKAAVAIVGVSLILGMGILVQSYRAEIATRQNELLERDRMLTSLLGEDDGVIAGEDRLAAIDQALGMSGMPEEDRVNLQIARVETLHRMQQFSEVRKFLRAIQPITLKQEGQLELWELLTSADFERQKAIASSLIARAGEVSLKEEDRLFLTSLTASTRADAIRQLEAMMIDYPRHEHGRKLLLALLLFQGDTVQFDNHYEKASLLFPGDNAIEYVAAVSYACRAERPGAESQLERWEDLPTVSEETGKFGKELVGMILELAVTMNRTGLWVEDTQPFDPARFLKRVVDLMNSYPGAESAVFELFGASWSVGLPNSKTVIEKEGFLGGLSTKIAVASAAQLIGGKSPTLTLFSDLEEKTPLPGDALFKRTRAWAIFERDQNDFAGAIKELEPATVAPCLFPGLRQHVLFECMMCHMKLLLDTKDGLHKEKALSLARQWAQIAESRPMLQVVQVMNTLQLCGFPEEALQLLRDFRTLSPNNVNLLIERELELLSALKRYPELIALAEKRLEETQLSEEQRTNVEKLRMDAMQNLADLVDVQQEKND